MSMLAPATTAEGMLVSYLAADSSLLAVALGGIYAYTSLGRMGINRDTTPDAYDEDGYLLPIVVVKTRSPLPNRDLYDEREKIVGMSQSVEFWIYQMVGYDQIELITNHIHRLLQGHSFVGYWPMNWIYTTGSLVDAGSLNGASLVRVDFQMRRIRSAI
jgi:hypothetical protein